MSIPTKEELQRVLSSRGVKGAAEMYAVGVSTIYRWIKKRGITAAEKGGCSNPNCKLTQEQVIEIYNQKGKKTVKVLASEFDVSTGTISNIHNFITHGDELVQHSLDERSQVA